MTPKIAIIRDDRFQEHKTGHTHPEHPNRLKAVYGMLDREFPGSFRLIRPEPAALEHLETVHTPVYIQKILKTADHDFTSLAPDTPVCAGSYLAAWLAAGGCIRGLDALMAGDCHACFALVRPPGHHALPDRAGGFCILNNLGIAARYAVNQHGLTRILIIDWDAHHGNGLQELFYREKKVLYFSTHDLLLYPFSGALEETGEDIGCGYTVNVPLPRDFVDAELVYVYEKILSRIVEKYRPQLILVSAGFDAHRLDPIGCFNFTRNLFGDLTRLVMELAHPLKCPVLFSLEGGYHARSLASSVQEVLRALKEEPGRKMIQGKETPNTIQLVENVFRIHSPFKIWTD